jgi:hypothetical protein
MKEDSIHHELPMNRREFLTATSVAALGTVLDAASLNAQAVEKPRGKNPAHAGIMMGVKFDPMKEVRLAIIGLGGRGTGMLPQWLGVEGVRVTALCDIVPEKVLAAQAVVERAGQARPASYTSSEHDFENMVRRDDIDLVYIATPWEWHVPMALATLQANHHVAIEVPAGQSIEELWQLVEASERTRRHCMMMENCCYGYNEMLVNRVVHDGALGHLLHAECAYLHDLREELFSGQGEGLWRRAWHTQRNGNLYPTHGLGPVAWYFDIHRGDRFDRLVSMSSPQAGLTAYRDQKVPKGDPRWNENYICGDLNSSLIQTSRGRTILVQHDTSNPTPYSRINSVRGTKGIFRDYPPQIYIDGREPEAWSGIDDLKSKYEHPLWASTGDLARQKGSHGGMDYVMIYRLVECMRQGLAPDFDVYDAAAWSAVGPLSVQSVAGGGAPVQFPDFTGGRWSQGRA